MTKPLSPPPELADFVSWSDLHDPFEDHAGPFFYKKCADDNYRAGFMPAPHHLNGGGFLHGGLLMAFIDFSLFVIAKQAPTSNAEYSVTVSCHTDFIRASAPTTPVYADGTVTRTTRSLVFITGRVFTCQQKQDDILATFTAILKLIRQPK